MISFGIPQLVLVLLSAALVAFAMVLIARAHHRPTGQRRRSAWGAGILGFGSGACLGAAATAGRPIGALLLTATVLGLVMGLATAGISHQVTAMTSRTQRRSSAPEFPQESVETED